MMLLRFALLLLLLPASAIGGFKCNTCKDITRKFNEGLEKTAKSNFGGGNTRWEEKSLGSYQFSETRLIEILESVCSDGIKECHTFIEHFEEAVEDWWFNYFAKKKDKDLHQWLCIDKSQSCCTAGSYGVVCLPCPGGQERPCRGNGRCDGDGEREGSGKCKCDDGYKGEQCEECADKHYEELRNSTDTVCKACHAACGTGCEGPHSTMCDDCADGWDEEEEGCFDINECDTSPCKESEYCTNTEGSYSCIECPSSCGQCNADGCLTCGDLYFSTELDPINCQACHQACDSSCTDATPNSCDACKAGWQLSAADGCQDINECDGEHDCDDDSYCLNTVGSFKCSTCHAYCDGCSGPGTNRCIACKSGYKHDEQSRCEDVDECTSDTPPCSGDAEVCINLPGKYRCDCQDGYVRADDKCMIKLKEDKPKPKKKKPVSKSRAYKGPGNCRTCQDIINNIYVGLSRTEGDNFGGGNTKWEEEKLGKYMYSETRLTEIMEVVCEKDSVKDQCYDMVEKYEDTIDKWWFEIYAKGQVIDLFQFLCIDNMMVCCPNGTFGAECKNCIGGRDQPCYGNGKCDGDGTRKGSGVCNCNKGYAGYQCDECAPLNYTSFHNDTHIECKGCYKACLTACFDDGPDSCEDCTKGWRFETEKGCVDVNECEPKSPCDDDEYCTNNVGSYVCTDCDDACAESCTGPGAGNCVQCNDLYFRDDDNVCQHCHAACRNKCTDARPQTCDACRSGWTEDEQEGCIDVDECADGSATCPDGQYCQNTVGSHSCLKCDRACQTCLAEGNDRCVACAHGFKMADSGECLDINECEGQGEKLCPGEGMQCVNTPGTFKCQCGEGLQKDKDGKCIPATKKVPKKKKPAKKSSKKKTGHKAKKDEL